MKTIRFGIIGYGFMGRTHAWGCRSLPFFYRDLPFNVELAAVASPSEHSRRLAVQEGGFPIADGRLAGAHRQPRCRRRGDIHAKLPAQGDAAGGDSRRQAYLLRQAADSHRR